MASFKVGDVADLKQTAFHSHIVSFHVGELISIFESRSQMNGLHKLSW